ncbi:hypothetical protein [Halalkalibacterium ligniniphilum]|uniref:hypothetical protein n=1 Tax=Halalkalibacterium ligniniphilum TaxID=1134413 RepID=UPI0003626D68|nr:hypothetical protein [Halalkalibacterium ligniniphilum]
MVNVKKFIGLAIGAYFFLAVFYQYSNFQRALGTIPLSTIITSFLVLVLIFYHMRKEHISIGYNDKLLLIGMFLPLYLSLISVLITIFTMDLQYQKYVWDSMLSRVLNLTLLGLFFILTRSYLYSISDNQKLKLLNYYLGGIYFLIAIGLWQWLSTTD